MVPSHADKGVSECQMTLRSAPVQEPGTQNNWKIHAPLGLGPVSTHCREQAMAAAGPAFQTQTTLAQPSGCLTPSRLCTCCALLLALPVHTVVIQNSAQVSLLHVVLPPRVYGDAPFVGAHASPPLIILPCRHAFTFSSASLCGLRRWRLRLLHLCMNYQGRGNKYLLNK